MNDCIAAPATAAVPSAIGILRLTGEDADAVASRVFTCQTGSLLTAPHRYLVSGHLHDDKGVVFDQAMACVMRAPHSYTGQTVVEIYCHGSPSIVQHTLTSLFAAGARPATAGEFTRRAVLNGKLDLLQAEAVGDLIDARTPVAAQNALGQLEGAVSKQIRQVWQLVTGVLTQVAAQVDYPEDDIPEITTSTILADLDAAIALLTRLCDSYERGKLLREGPSVALIGPPNAGKSSLFNALLGYDRAIVTPIAGTTRDSLEESLLVEGTRIRLQDTAGLHDATDEIEAEGIRRTQAILARCQLALVVLDGSQPVDTAHPLLQLPCPTLVVLTKADLPCLPPVPLPHPIVQVSSHTGQGLPALLAAMAVAVGVKPLEDTLVTNARHAHGMQTAREALLEAKQALQTGVAADIALSVLDISLDTLAELTGQTVNEAVLTQIFAKFCVGK